MAARRRAIARPRPTPAALVGDADAGTLARLTGTLVLEQRLAIERARLRFFEAEMQYQFAEIDPRQNIGQGVEHAFRARNLDHGGEVADPLLNLARDVVRPLIGQHTGRPLRAHAQTPHLCLDRIAAEGVVTESGSPARHRHLAHSTRVVPRSGSGMSYAVGKARIILRADRLRRVFEDRLVVAGRLRDAHVFADRLRHAAVVMAAQQLNGLPALAVARIVERR